MFWERSVQLKKFLPAAIAAAFACTDYSTPPGKLPPAEYGTFAMRSINAPAADQRPMAQEEVAPQMDAPPPAPANTAFVVSGTVSASNDLKIPGGRGVLFLIAKSPQGGPPLMVKRLEVSRFPIDFTLTQADLMMPGTPLPAQMTLTARLDADGSAGPAAPGDVENSQKPAFKPGQKNLRLTLDKKY